MRVQVACGCPVEQSAGERGLFAGRDTKPEPVGGAGDGDASRGTASGARVGELLNDVELISKPPPIALDQVVEPKRLPGGQASAFDRSGERGRQRRGQRCAVLVIPPGRCGQARRGVQSGGGASYRCIGDETRIADMRRNGLDGGDEPCSHPRALMGGNLGVAAEVGVDAKQAGGVVVDAGCGLDGKLEQMPAEFTVKRRRQDGRASQQIETIGRRVGLFASHPGGAHAEIGGAVRIGAAPGDGAGQLQPHLGGTVPQQQARGVGEPVEQRGRGAGVHRSLGDENCPCAVGLVVREPAMRGAVDAGREARLGECLDVAGRRLASGRAGCQDSSRGEWGDDVAPLPALVRALVIHMTVR